MTLNTRALKTLAAVGNDTKVVITTPGKSFPYLLDYGALKTDILNSVPVSTPESLAETLLVGNQTDTTPIVLTKQNSGIQSLAGDRLEMYTGTIELVVDYNGTYDTGLYSAKGGFSPSYSALFANGWDTALEVLIDGFGVRRIVGYTGQNGYFNISDGHHSASGIGLIAYNSVTSASYFSSLAANNQYNCATIISNNGTVGIGSALSLVMATDTFNITAGNKAVILGSDDVTYTNGTGAASTISSYLVTMGSATYSSVISTYEGGINKSGASAIIASNNSHLGHPLNELFNTHSGFFATNNVAGTSIENRKGIAIIASNAPDLTRVIKDYTLYADNISLLVNVTPASSADTVGSRGQITADDNYMYHKTSTGWKRSALTAF